MTPETLGRHAVEPGRADFGDRDRNEGQAREPAEHGQILEEGGRGRGKTATSHTPYFL